MVQERTSRILWCPGTHKFCYRKQQNYRKPFASLDNVPKKPSFLVWLMLFSWELPQWYCEQQKKNSTNRFQNVSLGDKTPLLCLKCTFPLLLRPCLVLEEKHIPWTVPEVMEYTKPTITTTKIAKLKVQHINTRCLIWEGNLAEKLVTSTVKKSMEASLLWAHAEGFARSLFLMLEAGGGREGTAFLAPSLGSLPCFTYDMS